MTVIKETSGEPQGLHFSHSAKKFLGKGQNGFQKNKLQYANIVYHDFSKAFNQVSHEFQL